MDEQSIFLAALEIEPPDARARWLVEACGADQSLRARIEALLDSHQVAKRFLERPAADFDATIVPAAGQDLAEVLQAGLAAAFGEDQSVVIGHAGHSVLKSLGQSVDKVPQVILREAADGRDPVVRPKSAEMPKSDSDSRYQLQGEIARGGMGAILKGRDTDLGRDLAIKVLLEQHKDKPEVVQRFVEEAQIGGQLQHPGIAPVYELGQFADRRPFFSMKLVKGETLSKLLANRKDPAEDRGRFIGIFEQVCQTMAYAHSRGVIHRDLKPANIMVGAFGEVQVMDWGLAKVLPAGGIADEKKAYDEQQGQSIIHTLRSQPGSDAPGSFGTHGSQTQMGSVMGTPAYMPPEQALGEIDHLDERADVFGLGAILCEILTGKPPYVADDGTRVFRMASRGKLEDCFRRLDACGADEELMTLSKHCLELEPSDRPRNASALAGRVTEYIGSVETRLRAAEVERAAEAARAEEALHTIAETEARTLAERNARRLQLTMAAIVAVVTTIGGLAAVWTAAEQSRLKSDALVAERDASLAREKEAGQRVLAEAAKTRAEQEKLRAETEKTRAEAAQQQADTEKRNSLNMLADMQTERGLLAGREGQSATAALWFANAAALTPHDLDRQRANHLRASSWLNEAMVPAALLKLPDGDVRHFEFQPNGSMALTISGSKVRVWDWRNESVLPWSEALADVTDADWSPDGRQLAVGFGNGDVRLCDSASGTELKRFQHSERVEVLQWSPDGTRLAVAGVRVQIWSVATEPVSESDWPHPKTIFGLRFNRAGTRLATSCNDEFARVFSVDDASLPAPLYAPVEHVPNHKGSYTNALFFDNDRRFVVVSRDSKTAVLYDAATGRPVTPGWTTINQSAFDCLVVSPDGRWVAAAGGVHGYLLSADGQSVELKHNNHVGSVSFHPDGRSLVTTCLDGTARWWPLQELSGGGMSVGSPSPIPQQGGYAASAFSPDGSSIAISSHRQIVIWERSHSQLAVRRIDWPDSYWKPRPSFDGQLVTPGKGHHYSFDVQPRGGTLRVARMPDGHRAGPPITLDGLLFDSCLCADNRSVAAVTVNGTKGSLGIFDVASGAPITPSIALPDVPISVAARPGQPQVAVLCRNGSLLVMDARSGMNTFDRSHDGATGLSLQARVAYSPDGATLLTVTPNNLVFARDAQTGDLRFPPLQPVLEGGPCRAIAFSSDSRLLATAVNGRNMVQVWDLMTGKRVGREMPHSGDIYGLFSVAFSPDGQRILTGHKDGNARLWDWQTGQLTGAPMKHPDEVFDAQFTSDGRHVVTAVRHSSPQVWDVATGKPAVPRPQIVPAGSSSDSLAISGDRVIVASGNQYSVLDLSLLHQKPKADLPALLTRAELTTNQKLQLGELVPLEQQEWSARWDELVAARQTPEEAAQSLARESDDAQSESARRAVVLRAMRFNLTERLQQLRPSDPHLQIALAVEFSRAGRLAELNRILPQAVPAVQRALQAATTSEARDSYELFLDVAAATDGRSLAETQTLLAKWDTLAELIRLGPEIEANPSNAALLSKRAEAYIATKQWKLARADWLRAVELQPDLARTAFDHFKVAQRWSDATVFASLLMKQRPQDSILWVQIPPIIVLAQDDAEYRSFCQDVVKHFRELPDGYAAERAIKGCLLREDAVDLAELPGDLLAQSLNDGAISDGVRPWGWATLALLKYRSGDAESAVKSVIHSERFNPHDYAHALNLAVLALAQHQLKHPDEARKALDDASQVIQRLQAVDKTYHDLLIAEILFREAEAKINGSGEPSKMP